VLVVEGRVIRNLGEPEEPGLEISHVGLVERIILRRQNVSVRPEILLLLMGIQANPNVIGFPYIDALGPWAVVVWAKQNVDPCARELAAATRSHEIGSRERKK
jgi:hypothetical protein